MDLHARAILLENAISDARDSLDRAQKILDGVSEALNGGEPLSRAERRRARKLEDKPARYI